MKKYEYFGIYDFEDLAEELSEQELLFVNGGSCGGGCGGSFSPTSTPTGPTSPSTPTSPVQGQCSGNIVNNDSEVDNSKNWKDFFPDPNGYDYDNEGIDPLLVNNKGTRLTREESDFAKTWMKELVETGDYKVSVNHSSYNGGIITSYTLYDINGTKALVSYYDTNNDGVVDYAK